ncbi:hypothetical protein BESB_011210 [Besnoitia besnoiti]|uniref:Uncharacterized protein n=1 Tax=Besnoitia besnoiti TaxID=94643 RepID=A0A2A9MLD1_BESBE|nr:hypothetical protein BESB_011210 [Besnoitia besnoiti]PFH38779.1 hypothetical protein BESB_011210 [Besnoitia besnoiti]
MSRETLSYDSTSPKLTTSLCPRSLAPSYKRFVISVKVSGPHSGVTEGSQVDHVGLAQVVLLSMSCLLRTNGWRYVMAKQRCLTEKGGQQQPPALVPGAAPGRLSAAGRNRPSPDCVPCLAVYGESLLDGPCGGGLDEDACHQSSEWCSSAPFHASEQRSDTEGSESQGRPYSDYREDGACVARYSCLRDPASAGAVYGGAAHTLFKPVNLHPKEPCMANRFTFQGNSVCMRRHDSTPVEHMAQSAASTVDGRLLTSVPAALKQAGFPRGSYLWHEEPSGGTPRSLSSLQKQRGPIEGDGRTSRTSSFLYLEAQEGDMLCAVEPASRDGDEGSSSPCSFAVSLLSAGSRASSASRASFPASPAFNFASAGEGLMEVSEGPGGLTALNEPLAAEESLKIEDVNTSQGLACATPASALPPRRSLDSDPTTPQSRSGIPVAEAFPRVRLPSRWETAAEAEGDSRSPLPGSDSACKDGCAGPQEESVSGDTRAPSLCVRRHNEPGRMTGDASEVDSHSPLLVAIGNQQASSALISELQEGAEKSQTPASPGDGCSGGVCSPSSGSAAGSASSPTATDVAVSLAAGRSVPCPAAASPQSSREFLSPLPACQGRANSTASGSGAASSGASVLLASALADVASFVSVGEEPPPPPSPSTSSPDQQASTAERILPKVSAPPETSAGRQAREQAVPGPASGDRGAARPSLETEESKTVESGARGESPPLHAPENSSRDPDGTAPESTRRSTNRGQPPSGGASSSGLDKRAGVDAAAPEAVPPSASGPEDRERSGAALVLATGDAAEITRGADSQVPTTEGMACTEDSEADEDDEARDATECPDSGAPAESLTAAERVLASVGRSMTTAIELGAASLVDFVTQTLSDLAAAPDASSQLHARAAGPASSWRGERLDDASRLASFRGPFAEHAAAASRPRSCSPSVLRLQRVRASDGHPLHSGDSACGGFTQPFTQPFAPVANSSAEFPSSCMLSWQSTDGGGPGVTPRQAEEGCSPSKENPLLRPPSRPAVRRLPPLPPRRGSAEASRGLAQARLRASPEGLNESRFRAKSAMNRRPRTPPCVPAVPPHPVASGTGSRAAAAEVAVSQLCFDARLASAMRAEPHEVESLARQTSPSDGSQTPHLWRPPQSSANFYTRGPPPVSPMRPQDTDYRVAPRRHSFAFPSSAFSLRVSDTGGPRFSGHSLTSHDGGFYPTCSPASLMDREGLLKIDALHHAAAAFSPADHAASAKRAVLFAYPAVPVYPSAPGFPVGPRIAPVEPRAPSPSVQYSVGPRLQLPQPISHRLGGVRCVTPSNAATCRMRSGSAPVSTAPSSVNAYSACGHRSVRNAGETAVVSQTVMGARSTGGQFGGGQGLQPCRLLRHSTDMQHRGVCERPMAQDGGEAPDSQRCQRESTSQMCAQECPISAAPGSQLEAAADAIRTPREVPCAWTSYAPNGQRPREYKKPPSPLRARWLREELCRQAEAGLLRRENFPMEEFQDLVEPFEVVNIGGVNVYKLEAGWQGPDSVPPSQEWVERNHIEGTEFTANLEAITDVANALYASPFPN